MMRLESGGDADTLAASDSVVKSEFETPVMKKGIHRENILMEGMSRARHCGGGYAHGPGSGCDFLGNNLAAYFSRLFQKNPPGEEAILELIGAPGRKERKKCKTENHNNTNLFC